MINFKDYLIEGRDAPLYHGARWSEFLSILNDKVIEAKTMQPFRNINSSIKNARLNFKRGVSLSRSLKFSKYFTLDDIQSKAVFVIDQAALSKARKLVPYNFWVNSGGWNSDKAREMDHGWRSGPNPPEFEEFCIGTIPMKYWTEIMIYRPIYEANKEQVDELLSSIPVKVSTYD